MPWMDRATVLANHPAAPARLAERLERRACVPWHVVTHSDTTVQLEPTGRSGRGAGPTTELGRSGGTLGPGGSGRSASPQATSALDTLRRFGGGDHTQAASPANGATPAEVEPGGGRHPHDVAPVASRSVPSYRDRTSGTEGSPGREEPPTRSTETFTTPAPRPGPQGSHDDAIRRRSDDDPRVDPRLPRPLGGTHPATVDLVDRLPTTALIADTGSVTTTREPTAAHAGAAGQPGGALGELVRNWSTARAPQVLAVDRVDERRRLAIGAADVDDRPPRPARPSARPLRSASDAAAFAPSTASISTSATPESMIDDLVERALDRIVQRDAERHMIEWGRT